MTPCESSIRRRGEAIFRDQLDAVRAATDKVFLTLMPAQWLLGIVIALWLSPRAWAGSQSAPHVHLFAAIILGGAIASLPIYLGLTRPGATVTRHVIAAAQMLTSALLIHLTGGRIETHFHIFGSLAILAYYRDRRVLVTGVAVAVADHALRGIFAPQSVYGTAIVQPLRFLEHGGWVLFETLPLIYLTRQRLDEMRENAARQAELEAIGAEFEAKVQERTRELEEANERAAAAREAAQENELLKERHQLHNQFLANVSHDLRTPITAIKGFAETLLQGGLDDAKRRASFVRTIDKNAERLRVLVENLLDLAMLDGLKVQPRPATISVSECLAELADDFAPQAKRKRVTIEVGAPEGLSARADAGHTWQVLQNLLSNAVKFSPPGGKISVGTRREGDRIFITVSDEGPGVPEKELDLIFKRFHGGGRGTKTREGSGLGLSISRTLAELNGGELAARRIEGSGALFTLALPAAPQPAN